jgi:aminoglycoside 6-adenylyltransferase
MNKTIRGLEGSKYREIIENLVRWGAQDEKLKILMVIGSQARNEHKADDFSDLDIIMIVDEPEHFLFTNHWLEKIGVFHVSFIEETLAGQKERRIIFDNNLDVDFVILPQNIITSFFKNTDALNILKHGYNVLIDKIGITKEIPENLQGIHQYTFPTEWEFMNTVNDFWYHAVWSAKKINRGELWTAKFCVDSYMKWIILKNIEHYSKTKIGLNQETWHNGRFIEEWAEPWIIDSLSECFSHYKKNDIKKALISTMELFRTITLKITGKLGFNYPKDVDTKATQWVKSLLE